MTFFAILWCSANLRWSDPYFCCDQSFATMQPLTSDVIEYYAPVHLWSDMYGRELAWSGAPDWWWSDHGTLLGHGTQRRDT